MPVSGRLTVLLGWLCLAAGLAAEQLGEKFGHENDLGSREGPFHYIEQGGLRLERFEQDGFLKLFDARKDPLLQTNAANRFPAETARLLGRLRERYNLGPDPGPRAQPVESDSELPPHVIRPSAAGDILLHARDVEVHGSTVRYEPQTNKNTIGYWTKREDWVSWDFYAPKAGAYKVEILQGCGPKSGGSAVAFQCNGQELEVTVKETRHFQDFIAREIGELEFKQAGRYTLAVRPKTKPGAAVMDLRQVTLKPGR